MERKLTAILCADVFGYSRLMGKNEEATLRSLSSSRKLIDSLIEQHRGRFVNSAGDSVLAEFASVVNAVQCAVEIQATLKTENANLPSDRRMEFRIGVNLGDVMVDGEQIYGDGVNVAARLESLAEPGGICISGKVHDEIRSKLALGYQDLGAQQVKNITEPVRVFRVMLEGGTANATRTTAKAKERSLRKHWHGGVFSLAEQEYFSDGITDDLTTALSRLPGLFVIDRNSAFTYKGKPVKAQQVSRELGVRYVLEGSVRKEADQVRITAQLADATTGADLWAVHYDRPLRDIFALQDEIVQRIVTTLNLQLDLMQRGADVRQTTDNLEAYDNFLRGLVYIWSLTKGDNAKARQMFEKAIGLDPKYARAYAALGYSYWVAWAHQWSHDPHFLDRALQLEQQTIALDDSLAFAHMALGQIYLYKKQYDQATAEAERAIALDPNSAFGYRALAFIMNWSGKPAEGIGLAEKAMRVDPRNRDYYLWLEGGSYTQMGRYEEAIPILKRHLARYPNSFGAHYILVLDYTELGREDEARAEATEVLRLSPNFSLDAEKRLNPQKDQTVANRFYADLRKAGLK